jgi:hypothetical protein
VDVGCYTYLLDGLPEPLIEISIALISALGFFCGVEKIIVKVKEQICRKTFDGLFCKKWQRIKNCGEEVFYKKVCVCKKHFRTVKINNNKLNKLTL